MLGGRLRRKDYKNKVHIMDLLYHKENEMDVNGIANCLMSRFRETNSKVNHVIDQRWIQFQFASNLNPKEQDLINDAAKLLQNEGFITIENRMGMPCLVLTQKGFDAIYDNDKVAIINKIRNDIMGKFAENKSRVGHGLDQRWIQLTYMLTLNPVEQNYVVDAINSLESDGLIEIKQDGMFVLLLTQKGFDEIY
jgi:hypothetical protein